MSAPPPGGLLILIGIWFLTLRGSRRIAFCVGFKFGDSAPSSPRVNPVFQLFGRLRQGRTSLIGRKPPEAGLAGKKLALRAVQWRWNQY
jgi:hypothetical protein